MPIKKKDDFTSIKADKLIKEAEAAAKKASAEVQKFLETSQKKIDAIEGSLGKHTNLNYVNKDGEEGGERFAHPTAEGDITKNLNSTREIFEIGAKQKSEMTRIDNIIKNLKSGVNKNKRLSSSVNSLIKDYKNIENKIKEANNIIKQWNGGISPETLTQINDRLDQEIQDLEMRAEKISTSTIKVEEKNIQRKPRKQREVTRNGGTRARIENAEFNGRQNIKQQESQPKRLFPQTDKERIKNNKRAIEEASKILEESNRSIKAKMAARVDIEAQEKKQKIEEQRIKDRQTIIKKKGQLDLGEFYFNPVKLDTSDDKHFYYEVSRSKKYNEIVRQLPHFSVTQLLGLAMDSGEPLSEESDNRIKLAGDKGTAFHSIIEQLNKKKLKNNPQAISDYFRKQLKVPNSKFLSFFKKSIRDEITFDQLTEEQIKEQSDIINKSVAIMGGFQNALFEKMGIDRTKGGDDWSVLSEQALSGIFGTELGSAVLSGTADAIIKGMGDAVIGLADYKTTTGTRVENGAQLQILRFLSALAGYDVDSNTQLEVLRVPWSNSKNTAPFSQEHKPLALQEVVESLIMPLLEMGLVTQNVSIDTETKKKYKETAAKAILSLNAGQSVYQKEKFTGWDGKSFEANALNGKSFKSYFVKNSGYDAQSIISLLKNLPLSQLQAAVNYIRNKDSSGNYFLRSSNNKTLDFEKVEQVRDFAKSVRGIGLDIDELWYLEKEGDVDYDPQYGPQIGGYAIGTWLNLIADNPDKEKEIHETLFNILRRKPGDDIETRLYKTLAANRLLTKTDDEYIFEHMKKFNPEGMEKEAIGEARARHQQRIQPKLAASARLKDSPLFGHRDIETDWREWSGDQQLSSTDQEILDRALKATYGDWERAREVELLEEEENRLYDDVEVVDEDKLGHLLARATSITEAYEVIFSPLYEEYLESQKKAGKDKNMTLHEYIKNIGLYGRELPLQQFNEGLRIKERIKGSASTYDTLYKLSNLDEIDEDLSPSTLSTVRFLKVYLKDNQNIYTNELLDAYDSAVGVNPEGGASKKAIYMANTHRLGEGYPILTEYGYKKLDEWHNSDNSDTFVHPSVTATDLESMSEETKELLNRVGSFLMYLKLPEYKKKATDKGLSGKESADKGLSNEDSSTESDLVIESDLGKKESKSTSAPITTGVSSPGIGGNTIISGVPTVIVIGNDVRVIKGDDSSDSGNSGDGKKKKKPSAKKENKSKADNDSKNSENSDTINPQNLKEYIALLKERSHLRIQHATNERAAALTSHSSARKAYAAHNAEIEIEARGIQEQIELQKKSGKISAENLDKYEAEYVQLDKMRLLALNAKKEGVFNIWDSLRNSFKGMITQFIQMGFAYKLIGQVRQGIQKFIDTSKELNKVLVNLQIVTEYSTKRTKDLIDTYSVMGQELGATTIEVAEAANSWLRQGYAINEVNELITASLYLSKLGMIDSAAATQYLTSVLKGFKLEATEALGVVDKLTALDLVSATSAGGIAEALRQFATTAQLSGVNLDQASAMAATIIDVSQRDPSSVGAALKTMLSRFGNVKAGAFTSLNLEGDSAEGGENINDIEKVLNKIGISMRTSNLEFRKFDDVLEDISQKWLTLDTVSKNAIATAMAGIRQRESFLVLMENMDKYRSLTETAATAEGTATRKYISYQEQLEASQKKMQAAWEEFVNSSEVQQFLKKVTDTMTNVIKWLPVILKYTTRLVATFNAYKLPKMLAGMFQPLKNMYDNWKEGEAKLSFKPVKDFWNRRNQKIAGYSARERIPQLEETNQWLTRIYNTVREVSGIEKTKQYSGRTFSSAKTGILSSRRGVYSTAPTPIVDSLFTGDSLFNANIPLKPLSTDITPSGMIATAGGGLAVSYPTVIPSTERDLYTNLPPSSSLKVGVDLEPAELPISSPKYVIPAPSSDSYSSATPVVIPVGGTYLPPSEAEIKKSAAIKQQKAANAASVATVAVGTVTNVASTLAAGSTHKSQASGEDVQSSKEANIASAVTSGVSTAALGAAGAALAGPFGAQLGVMLGGVLGDLLGKLFAQQIDAERDARNWRVEKAEKALKELQEIDRSVNGLQDVLSNDAQSFEGYSEIVKAIDSVKDTLAENPNAMKNILEILVKKGTLPEGATMQDLFQWLDKFATDNSTERTQILAMLQVATQTAISREEFKTKENEFYEATKDLKAPTYQVREQTDPAWGEETTYIGNAERFLKWAEENGIKVDDESYDMGYIEHNYSIVNTGWESYIANLESYQNFLRDLGETNTEEFKELTESIEGVKKAWAELKTVYDKMNLSLAQTAILAAQTADGLDLITANIFQLKRAGKDAVYEAIAAQLKANGGLYGYDVDSKEGQEIIQKAIKSNQLLYSLWSGQAYTLNEALKLGDTDVLSQFAQALGVAVDKLILLKDEYGQITLAQLLGPPEDIRATTGELLGILSSLTSAGGLTGENLEKIISTFPQFIQYLGDTQDLMGQIMTLVNQQNNAYVKNIFSDLMESAPYFETLKKQLSEEDLKVFEKNETFGGATKTSQIKELLAADPSTVLEKYGIPPELQQKIKDAYSQLFTFEIEDTLNKQILNDVIKYQTMLYDKQIENLNQQKEALQKINEQRSYENKLIEAKLKLENASKDKKRVWREGVGWVYEADQGAIADAQKELDKLDTEKQIAALDMQVAQLALEKQTLEELEKNKEFEHLAKNFEEWKKSLDESVTSQTGVIDAITDLYNRLGITISGDEEIEDFKEARDSLFKDIYGRSFDDLEDYENYKLGTGSAWDDLQYYRWRMEKYKDDKSSKEYKDAESGYNRALTDYREKADDFTSGYDARGYYVNGANGSTQDQKDARTGKDGGYNYSHEGFDKINFRGVPYKLDTPGMPLLDSSDTVTNLRKSAGAKGDQAYLELWKPNSKGEYLPSNIEDVYDEKLEDKYQGDFQKVIDDAKPFTIFAPRWNDRNSYENMAIKAGDTTGGGQGYLYGLTPAARGSLGLPGGLSLLNELGPEAIITPAGTVTSLPSKTGVVPADITKNLWQLGELAPNIITGLLNPWEQGIYKNLSTGNHDESFKVNTINMTVNADSTFNPEEWVAAIKNRAALTKNNR